MILSFVYLDEYKMYSMYSQLFGGVPQHKDVQTQTTAAVVETASSIGKKIDHDRTSSHTSEERRIEFDHAYIQLERELMSRGLVTDLEAESSAGREVDWAKIAQGKRFVRATGLSLFWDFRQLQASFESLHELANAINVVVRNAPAESRAKKIDAKEFVERDYLRSLGKLIKYGYGDALEVEVNSSLGKVSSVLRRDGLREPENILIHKYGRRTSVPLTVFGTYVRLLSAEGEEEDPSAKSPPPSSPKSAISLAMQGLSKFEGAFFNSDVTTMVLDPIAIYRVLQAPDFPEITQS